MNPQIWRSSRCPRGLSLGYPARFSDRQVPIGCGGVTLGYGTLYFWFDEDDIMITLQTNSQPADGTDRLSDAAVAIYGAVKPPRSSTPPFP